MPHQHLIGQKINDFTGPNITSDNLAQKSRMNRASDKYLDVSLSHTVIGNTYGVLLLNYAFHICKKGKERKKEETEWNQFIKPLLDIFPFFKIKL